MCCRCHVDRLLSSFVEDLVLGIRILLLLLAIVMCIIAHQIRSIGTA